MYPDLARYVDARLAELARIPEDRREKLHDLAGFVQDRIRSERDTSLICICTHNSRRSHLAQVWAQTAAAWYGVARVRTFSGGTEATAFDLRAVAALERAGFRVDRVETGGTPSGRTSANPLYHVRFRDDAEPMTCFSKVYDQDPNPRRDFCAVMTCAQADRNCPVVVGAARRVSIPYDDPKDKDGTEEETAAYDERCRQIAREMLCSFSRVRVS
jgi:arsenate reductase